MASQTMVLAATRSMLLPLMMITMMTAKTTSADNLMIFTDRLVTYDAAVRICADHNGRLITDTDLRNSTIQFPNVTERHNDPFQFWIAKPPLKASPKTITIKTAPSAPAVQFQVLEATAISPDDRVAGQSPTGPSSPNSKGPGAVMDPTGRDDSMTDAHDDRRGADRQQPKARENGGGRQSPSGTRGDDDMGNRKKGKRSQPSGSDSSDGDGDDDDDDDDDDDKSDEPVSYDKRKPQQPPSDNGGRLTKQEIISKGTGAEAKAAAASSHSQDVDDLADNGRVPGLKPEKGTTLTIRKMSEDERRSKKQLVDAIEAKAAASADPSISQQPANLPDASATKDDFVSSKVTNPTTTTTGTTMLEAGRVKEQKPAASAADGPTQAVAGAFPASSVQMAIASGMISPTTQLMMMPSSSSSASSPSSAPGMARPASTPPSSATGTAVVGGGSPPPSSVAPISPNDGSFQPAVPKPNGFGFQALSVDNEGSDPQVPSCTTQLASKRLRAFCSEIHIPICVVASP